MFFKLKYLGNFFINYNKILFPTLFYEIIYSLKYFEFGSHLTGSKNSVATDTVPCVYYFLNKIAKFIKKNKIKSIIDLGSGFGRVTNFLADNTNSKITGFELDKQVFEKSIKLKNKRVKIFNKNILEVNFSKNKAKCYIMIDPLKKPKDTIELQKKIISANKQKKNKTYIVIVNINKKLINKKLKIIESFRVNKNKTGYSPSITFCYI